MSEAYGFQVEVYWSVMVSNAWRIGSRDWEDRGFNALQKELIYLCAISYKG